EGDLRGYRSVGESTVIAGRAQIGSVFMTSIEDTPPDFLFFSGGGGTVRGQGFQSLAIDGAGGTSGGRSFAGLSLELRQGISDSIGLVGFFDVGYIGESSDLQGGGDHSGAGLGLRYITPLGPLRVDVGVPVGGSSDGSDYGLYIGLGQAF
ncbi:MAG: BamA/TamA family outer membrane protein, partial [Pseudomonadota bacterium]